MNEKYVSLPQRLLAEMLGTAFLLAAVVGSGIMAQRLSGGNGALALLCNTLPTGAILTVLILTFGPFRRAFQSRRQRGLFAARRNAVADRWLVRRGAALIQNRRQEPRGDISFEQPVAVL